MTVYVVESGDYEQRGIDGIYASEQAAIDGIKAVYGPPFIVRWDEPVRDMERPSLTLTGHFEAVLGYSTDNETTFEITPYEVGQ